MAKVIHDSDKNYNNIFPLSLADCLHKHGGTRTAEAVALYEAGYRKQSEGEWEYVNGDIGYDEYGCSICGENVAFYDEEDKYNFCPNCGAKMKGGAE